MTFVINRSTHVVRSLIPHGCAKTVNFYYRLPVEKPLILVIELFAFGN